MFGLFRKKSLSHDEKLEQAYSCYKKEMVGMVFPKGKNQADIVIKSIAKIINVDLDRHSPVHYYEILSIYSDTLIRIVITKSSDDKIINALLKKHEKYIHSKDVARKVLAYCVLNISDNYFSLSSDADYFQLEKAISYSAVPQQPSIINKLLTETKVKIQETLSNTEIWDNDFSAEIVPLLVVICDFIAMCEQKNRDDINQKTIQWANTTIKWARSQNWLYNRIDFYGQVIRNKKIRGEWLFGDTTKYSDSPILRCIVAFGDIIVNPSCVEDYYNAPLQINDFTSIITFAMVMNSSVFEIIASFCDSIASI